MSNLPISESTPSRISARVQPRERRSAVPTTQIDPPNGTPIASSAGQSAGQWQGLTVGQAQAAAQLLAQLDRQTSGLIGLYGTSLSGKTTLLNALIAPPAGRRVRTPDHRKVIGLTIDAGAAHVQDSKPAWQHLLLNTLELMWSHAMPTERKTINELRSELVRAARSSTNTGERAESDHRLALAAFAHHFRAVFPRLVTNVFTLSNAVLVIGIDHLDRAPAGQAGEWLEAAAYFLNAPGCFVVVCADETALAARLGQANRPAEALSEASAGIAGDGIALLHKWVVKKVTIEVAVAPFATTAEMVSTRREPQPTVPARRAGGATAPENIPPACMQLITTALQPDQRLIHIAGENWRTAMPAVIKRAEDQLGNPIPATLIAKLAALQALSPQLFDAGRYNPQLLVTLERQLRGDLSAPPHDDWYGAVSQHSKLKWLITAEPSFSELPLRDLAAALRMTYAGQEPDNTQPAQSTPLTASLPHDTPAALSSAPQTQSTGKGSVFSLELPAWVSMITAGGVFIVDRTAKLLVLTSGPAAMFHPGGASGTSGALAVGAELFGVALCALILLFWGGARPQRLYSISLGCILGALLSNLSDRLAYTYVVNFIQVGNLPVFNLSHAALVIGAILLAASLVRSGLSRNGQPQP
ncbi:MAG: signal peptidase II [Anaerolineae bacterium]|nr:signal peptidase II [Thermoflexales bacterium]MDW8407017.1 signal peptidase II [Anaerolineae bacterium]